MSVGGAQKGRPRSQAAESAILSAATELLKEMKPSDISADAIARRAGVSKATLYKWWPSRAHVLLDTIFHNNQQSITYPDTGSVIEDFVVIMRNFVRYHTENPIGIATTFIFAEGMIYPELRDIFNERFALKRRAGLRAILARGVERGELSATVDHDLVLDLLHGPLILRFFQGHAPMTELYAEEIVRTLMPVFAPRPGEAGSLANCDLTPQAV